MINSVQPIGVFDSGAGGLSVLKELINILPNEHYIYFGDTKRLPYGDKSQDELISCTKRILDYFKTQNVKLVVAACNTCSANTIPILRDFYDFRICGMIEPTANYIKTLKEKTLGLIATTATVNSHAYQKALSQYGKELYELATPELVKLVESGDIYSKYAQEIVFEYLNNLLNKKIEKLILGCTHYPFLIDLMVKNGLSKDFFINPALCVANEIKTYLLSNNLLNPHSTDKIEFFVSANAKEFKDNAKLFFGNIDLPDIILAN